MNNKLVKEKYKVKDFCNKYKNTTIEETKAGLIEKVMNPHYVPYEMKTTICESIINATYYKKSNDGKTKSLYVNSPAQYMLFCLNLVKEYTHIEVDFKSALEEFNLLNESELIDVIYSNIPERELKEFKMLLDMVESDVMQNEYETHAFISKQVERFGELIGHIANPALNKLSEAVSNIDDKTVDKLVGKLKELDKGKGIFSVVK